MFQATASKSEVVAGKTICKRKEKTHLSSGLELLQNDKRFHQESARQMKEDLGM